MVVIRWFMIIGLIAIHLGEPKGTYASTVSDAVLAFVAPSIASCRERCGDEPLGDTSGLHSLREGSRRIIVASSTWASSGGGSLMRRSSLRDEGPSASADFAITW